MCFSLINKSAEGTLASTILHELIHAELHRIKLTNNEGPHALSTTKYNWYIKMWKSYENIYPTQNEVASAAEHFYMANYFINPIAEGLREYDNNSNNVENYKFFAWTGLEYYGKTPNFLYPVIRWFPVAAAYRGPNSIKGYFVTHASANAQIRINP